MFKVLLLLLIFLGLANFSCAQSQFEKDTFQTSEGELGITFIGHGTLMFTFQDKVIHVDPWSNLADYNQLPKADIVLITHEHYDHLDLNAIELIKKEDTLVVLTELCAEKIDTGVIMKNGDVQTLKDIKIEAVPAYNIQHKRDNGQHFHPKGAGNGYILTLGELRVYVAGDTENIPEMKDIENIDIAFLPMNLPYTMTPEMVADAGKMVKPKILYPYHFGDTDTNQLIELLKDQKDIEVRIRKMS
jgi:L-ascorbate metabolism protein UlaG (beta-lactamase superfamily)